MNKITPARPYQKVHTFLKHHPVGVLSTVTDSGEPWGSAIYYVADENFIFYFLTRSGTFKFKNLDKTPYAALTIADNDSQTTVQLSGKVTKIPAKDYMKIVFDKLENIRPKDDHYWSPPLTKIHKGNYMPLCLTPTRLQYANYKHVKSDIHSNYIETIIPSH